MKDFMREDCKLREQIPIYELLSGREKKEEPYKLKELNRKSHKEIGKGWLVFNRE